ncbi:MAG: DNA repair protein RadC [Candidatus Pacebacteria bacterium]|jgi:DNA repair protein RadC|nr:DNA repair protein RadC [Candidatus Paceibacterota bacterium]
MARIKDLEKVDRPREKMEKYGPDKLADSELLAVLLGSGIKGLNVLTLSKQIIKLIEKVGSEKITLEDLLKEKGLGKAKAMQVIAALEFGKRVNAPKPEILTPDDVWKLCADFRASKKEHFVAFYLDTQNKLIERQIISIGTLNASLVHPREVFEPAVALHAASVIVAHNHPSQNIEESAEDLAITKRLSESGKILGIGIIDHVIVTANSFTSLKDKSLI